MTLKEEDSESPSPCKASYAAHFLFSIHQNSCCTRRKYLLWYLHMKITFPRPDRPFAVIVSIIDWRFDFQTLSCNTVTSLACNVSQHCTNKDESWLLPFFLHILVNISQRSLLTSKIKEQTYFSTNAWRAPWILHWCPKCADTLVYFLHSQFSSNKSSFTFKHLR